MHIAPTENRNLPQMRSLGRGIVGGSRQGGQGRWQAPESSHDSNGHVDQPPAGPPHQDGSRSHSKSSYDVSAGGTPHL